MFNTNLDQELEVRAIHIEDVPITRPSNINIEDSAENLKRAITGKLVHNEKRVAVEQNVPHHYKKALSTAQADTETSPTYKVTATYERINNTIRRRPNCPLPPKPANIPIRHPLQAKHDAEDESMVQQFQFLLGLVSPMDPPQFRFEANSQAAIHNFNLLQHHDFQLEKLLNSPKSSATAYGSEFKSSSHIQALLGQHHRWPQLQARLSQGADFPLRELPDDIRQKDFAAALERGNHKSADKNIQFLAKAMQDEVEKGWALIIRAEDAEKYPHLELAPLGVAEHIGISASGEFVPKMRVTHDLSFRGAYSDESVNSRVEGDKLEPCMFGHTLLRVIHRIVHSRLRHPDKVIWLRKEDFKSAYRRLHLKASTSITSAVAIEFGGEKFILIPLRLPFGGSPCPSDFCVVSDVITDAINDLMGNPAWDPSQIHSSYVDKIPAAKLAPHDIPFAPGRPLCVQLPDNDDASADCFVDDIITSAVDVADNLQRITAAPCTVIHALAHTASADTHIQRNNMIADDKNEAEGAPEETKICLGWILDTRRLLVTLPDHKFIAWSAQTQATIDQKSANNKQLSSLLGRLEHVAIVIPMFAHFLNNLRTLQITAEQQQHNVRISQRVRDDLILSKEFLKAANRGISMNLMTFRVPDKTYINDASEHGLGGFATHGRAWRWNIPTKLQGRAHINLLEFIAQLISIWIDVLEGRTEAQDCLLGMGDSTAAMGWLRRSNFREKHEKDVEWLVKQQIARKVASVILQAEAVLYRQWFRGEDNVVADSLSRDCYYLSPAAHENFLLTTVPSQLPQNFRILPVPAEISSFVSSTLEQLPVQPLRFRPQKPSELAHSEIGALSSIASDWRTRSTLTSSPISRKTSSWPPSPKPSEKHPSLQDLERIWWREQSMPPSHMWLRPSGQTTGRIPDWTRMARHALSSKNSYEHTETRTDLATNKKRSR